MTVKSAWNMKPRNHHRPNPLTAPDLLTLPQLMLATREIFSV